MSVLVTVWLEKHSFVSKGSCACWRLSWLETGRHSSHLPWEGQGCVPEKFWPQLAALEEELGLTEDLRIEFFFRPTAARKTK